MPVPKEILYLTEADVKQTLTVSEAVDLAEKGIKADGHGKVNGDKFYMDVGENGFVKPFSGYIEGEEYTFIKTFSYFPKNPKKYNRPPTSSMVILLDAETGLPACLMEASWVTGLKTAASTAVTTAYLARPESETVTIFGAGTLGRLHLMAVAERFKLKQAYYVDILPEVAEKCAAELEAIVGFPVKAINLEERESVVRKSDIIFTVTTGNQALFEHAWLKPGTSIARLGSYQEVDYDVITKADKVIVDRWKYVSPRIPEIVDLVNKGEFSMDRVYAEWPSIAAEKVPGRESPEEIIVYIALGIWGEYAVILPEVYRAARAKGLGKGLPCSND
ncbi:MAG: ornithine cyclodeaminase family protein [Anaerolineales bacterium]|jgi:ornithine cyclodeaminase/alanine dehydrogenase-like protein (mu-crystallin family)